MTGMVDPVRITSVVLVCHDCRKGLEGLGARVTDGVTSISLGHACEAHPRRDHVQAQHAVRVSPSALREWRSQPAPAPELIPEGATFVDVATLGAILLTGQGAASDAEVEAAIGTARKLLSVAKNEGRTS